MSEWVLKSESNTDKVFAEVDDDGNETGEYRYELGSVVTEAPVETREVHAPDATISPILLVPTSQLKPRKRWPYVAVGFVAGAAGILIAEVTRWVT